MRVLICGIIGAIAAAAGWMALEHTYTQEFSWMAVVVGLVTGLAINGAAGAKARGSYVRGALAVALALVACVFCRQVYAKVMAKTNVGASAVATAEPAEEVDDTKTETAEPEVKNESERTNPLNVERGGGGASVRGMRIDKGLSQWDMLWLSLSALSAYVVGKGRDKVVAQEEAAENPEPAEGSSEASDAEASDAESE